MKKIIVIFVGVLFLSGCAKARYLDQLLTLKDLADEQVRMGQYVEKQDQNFELMVKEMKAGTLSSRYSDKKKILRAFGEPVYVKNITEGNQELESWMYRYAVEFFGSDKVYLYFNSSGNLVKSEYIEGKDGKIKKKAETKGGRQKDR